MGITSAEVTWAGVLVAIIAVLLVVRGRAVAVEVRSRAAVLLVAVAVLDLIRVLTPSAAPSPPFGAEEYLSFVALAVGGGAAWSLRDRFFPDAAGSLVPPLVAGAVASGMAALLLVVRGVLAPGATQVLSAGSAFVVHTLWVGGLLGLATPLLRQAWRQPARSLRVRQLLAAGGLVLLVASIIVRTGAWLLQHADLRLVGHWLGTLGVVAFAFGIAPPGWLRAIITRSRVTALRHAQRDLIQYATTVEQVASRGLRHGARIVGARHGVVVDGQGQVLAQLGDRLAQVLLEVGAPEPAADSTVDYMHIASLRVLVVPLGPSAPGLRLMFDVGPLMPLLGDLEVQEVAVHGQALGVALHRLRRTSSERRERDAQRRLLKGVELGGQGVLRLEDHQVTHLTPWLRDLDRSWLADVGRFGPEKALRQHGGPPLLEQILTGTPATAEASVVAPGDDERHLHVTASVEGPGTATLVVRDMTEAVLAKRELESRRRLLADAEAVAHLGSWSWDAPTGVVLWTEELFRIFGLDPARHAPTFESYLESIHAEDREAAHGMVQRCLETGRPWMARYRACRPDGSLVWLETRGRVARRDAEGKVTGLEGTCRDVTLEHRRLLVLEDQHARLQALSRRVVDAQERERREIADHLHDALGQVITAIDLRVAGYLDSGDRGQLASARRELRILLEGIRDLAHYLRPPRLDDVGLPTALETLVDSVRRLYDVDLSLHLDIDGSLGLGSEGRLCAYRVVQESLTNACRHAPGAPITVRVTERSDGLVVEVADDGPGFDLEAVPRQVTGISAMSERAASLGGWLDVITEPGAGTLVRVEIPRSLDIDLRSPDGEAVTSGQESP